jgi:hypothetical protein
MKMPERMFSGRSRSTSLDTVYSEMKNRKTEDPKFYAPGRQVCGFTLAPCQRELKWDEAQSIRFIESAWLGLHLGEWIVNAQEWDGPDGQAHPLSGVLIDGQQRLHALELYWEDAFPVFGHKWSALDQVEQRRFLRRGFSSAEVSIWDDQVMRELSDRLNFGGTPHLESERAVQPGTPTKIRRGP